MTLKSREWDTTESGESLSKNKLTYFEVGQIYKMELVITGYGNLTDTGCNLIAFKNNTDVNNSSNEN